VLVDGIQINRGGGDFDFANLSTDGVERIEIVRGPTSALYGSDAVASVIHIITRRGEGEMQGSVRALAGSDRTHEVGAALSGGSDLLRYSFGAGRYATDGVFSLNNDSDNSSFRGRLDYQPGERLSAVLTGSFTQSAFDFPTDEPGLDGVYPPLDPDQGRKTGESTLGLDLGWELSDRVEHRLALGWSHVRDRNFDGLDPIPSDFQGRRSLTDESRRTAEYRLIWKAAPAPELKSFVTLGLEHERERFETGTRSFSVQNGVRVRSGSASDERRSTTAGFVQAELAFAERAFLTLGLRVDDNSQFGSVANPLAALAWVFPETGLRLRASAATGFKEPSFNEILGFPGFAGPHLGLEPETSRSFEIGAEQSFAQDTVRLSLTWFRTDFEDLITFVGRANPPPGELAFQAANVQAVRSQGLEAELRWALTDRVRLGAAYTLLRTRIRDAGGIVNVSFQEGEALLRRPAHGGSAYIDYTGDRLELRLGGTWVGPRTDTNFGAPGGPERVRADPYVKLDLSASYRLYGVSSGRQLRLLLRAENLLNDTYQEALGLLAPGFRIYGGVDARF
jgi:vitamin B12 transporter